ncbi:MAG: hypothetical protein L6276_12500 [Acetobacterium sp.]|nr:hypothetical protein [Bacillota bacterium]MCG2731073.1 hypothetical protein [Acetobacterium sp.]
MKPYFKWMLSLLLLATLAVIVTGVMMAEELIWGLGLALLLFLIMLIPAIALRAKRLGRYDESKVLGSWAYSPEEARQVAQDMLGWQSKRNRWLVPFTAGCLAIIGGIFAMVLYEQFPEVPLWRWLSLLLAAGLPWAARGFYRWYLKRMIMKDPCETKIGWNFLLWGNVRPVFNERETLKAMDADLLEENGRFYLRVLYRSTGRMRYGGKVEFRDRVPLLVPDGCEVKARALVKLIRNGK